MTATRAMRAAAALAAAVACGGPEPAEPDAAPPVADLAIGTARADGTGFVDVAPGGDVALVPGSQGGFHVWVNVRVRGAAGPLVLWRSARRASDGALVLAASRTAVDVPAAAMETWWEPAAAAPSFLCPAPVGIDIDGEPLEFSVELATGDGDVLGTAAAVWVPRCPDGDLAALCADICSG
ncbi:MAG: hypothetical protein D6689_21405 [Deltaproteobacteria bacterium]|nr:MAG: hypothetical protein D6689_21405 [Deltaproteobacteria bacterium]